MPKTKYKTDDPDDVLDIIRVRVAKIKLSGPYATALADLQMVKLRIEQLIELMAAEEHQL
jgi:hypothetical protein